MNTTEKKKEQLNSRMRTYWKNHPDKYAKHLEAAREYMRKRREDPAARAADRDRDAITRLKRKGYIVLPENGGNTDEVHGSDDLP